MFAKFIFYADDANIIYSLDVHNKLLSLINNQAKSAHCNGLSLNLKTQYTILISRIMVDLQAKLVHCNGLSLNLKTRIMVDLQFA